MRRLPCLFLFLAALTVGSCGGGSGGGGPTLLGPFLVDFETRPDDGLFATVAMPLVIGYGATITAVSGGDLHDFKTANGWGFGGCDAVAISGDFMMGASGPSGPLEVTIVFSPPVARVDLALGDASGALVELTAYDAALAPIDSDGRIVGACPIALLTQSVDSGSQDLIASVRITGSFPAWDDLRVWRWSP